MLIKNYFQKLISYYVPKENLYKYAEPKKTMIWKTIIAKSIDKGYKTEQKT